MIFVLPILLYPILGIGVTKFAMALEQKPRVVIVVGTEYLPTTPALLNSAGDGFDPALFDTPTEADRMVVRQEPASSPWGDPRVRQEAIREGDAAAVMVIPPDLPEQLQREQESELPSRSITTAWTNPAKSRIYGSRNWWSDGVRALSTAGSNATRRPRAIPSRFR